MSVNSSYVLFATPDPQQRLKFLNENCTIDPVVQHQLLFSIFFKVVTGSIGFIGSTTLDLNGEPEFPVSLLPSDTLHQIRVSYQSMSVA